jgi:hypothetical protein
VKYQITIDALASIELFEAIEYFESISLGLGFKFLDDFEMLLNTLGQRPMSFGFFDEFHRRAVLSRFPYIIFFEIINDTVLIVRVRHASRDNKKIFP